MKYVKLIFLLCFMSCMSNDDIIESFDIQGRFVHEIPDCNNGGNSEINCTEFIDFTDDSTIDILIGGGDIVERTNYQQSENKIDVEQTPVLNFPISFLIQNDSTLIRMEDNEIWHKTE